MYERVGIVAQVFAEEIARALSEIVASQRPDHDSSLLSIASRGAIGQQLSGRLSGTTTDSQDGTLDSVPIHYFHPGSSTCGAGCLCHQKSAVGCQRSEVRQTTRDSGLKIYHLRRGIHWTRGELRTEFLIVDTTRMRHTATKPEFSLFVCSGPARRLRKLRRSFWSPPTYLSLQGLPRSLPRSSL